MDHIVVRRLIVSLVVLISIGTPAFAGVEQIVTDFKPLSAYIVMDMQGEYIIDKDAGHGVRTGDLFAAVAEGEKIIHPVTGEVLGTLDRVEAQLRVTRVKKGYSYAITLPGSKKLKAGDAVIRFQGIPASFWDMSSDGEPLFTELKAGLPALEWTAYVTADEINRQKTQRIQELEGLVFVLTDLGLEVRDATYQQIRFYSRSDLAGAGIAVAAKPAAVAAPIAITRTRPSMLAKPQTGIVAASQSSGTATGLGRPTTESEGVWNGPKMPGEMVGVAVADLDGDGVAETVTAFTNKVLIGSLAGGQYKGQGFIDIPKRTRLLGVDAADLDGNGRPELYISAVKLDISRDIEVVASLVAEEVNGQFRIIEDDIPYFLRRVEIPWEGTVIAAQRAADTERTYGGKVYRLKRQGNDFDNGSEIDFGTEKLTANGFLPIQSGDQRVVVLFDINERLEVVKLTGKKIWSSDEVLGGSSAYIVREDPNARGDKLRYYLKANLDKMSDGTILVPVNQGDSGMFSTKVFSESLLAGLVWDGDSLEEAWHTDPKGGYLADFQVADVDNDGRDEIVTGLVRGIGDNLVQSKLVVYELP